MQELWQSCVGGKGDEFSHSACRPGRTRGLSCEQPKPDSIRGFGKSSGCSGLDSLVELMVCTTLIN
jgi:hypothetical protein